jgi:hypothetical protein
VRPLADAGLPAGHHTASIAENDQLWASFTEAKSSGSTRRVAAAEDAVFRHYRPWALSLAEAACPGGANGPGHALYREAAEVGLAQAVLNWRHGGEGRFGDFARRSILSRIRHVPAGASHRRLYSPATQETARDSAQRVAPAGPSRLGAHTGAAEVALLDVHGTIVWVNDAWKAFGQDNGAAAGRTGVGTSYLAVCDAATSDPGSRKIARAIRRAAQGYSTGPVAVRIPCDAADRSRCYDVLITARREGHDVVGVAVALMEVSPTIWEIPPGVAPTRATPSVAATTISTLTPEKAMP